MLSIGKMKIFKTLVCLNKASIVEEELEEIEQYRMK